LRFECQYLHSPTAIYKQTNKQTLVNEFDELTYIHNR
jgi:hypothetical protein